MGESLTSQSRHGGVRRVLLVEPGKSLLHWRVHLPCLGLNFENSTLLLLNNSGMDVLAECVGMREFILRMFLLSFVYVVAITRLRIYSREVLLLNHWNRKILAH